MPETTEIQLGDFEIRKRPTYFEIYLRSPKIEEFFRNTTGGSTTPTATDQAASYPPARYRLSTTQTAQMRELNLGSVLHWGSTELFVGGKVNLSLLLASNLAEGAVIRIQTPVSAKSLKEYAEQFEEALVEFYDTFMRADTIRAEIVVYEEQTSSRN